MPAPRRFTLTPLCALILMSGGHSGTPAIRAAGDDGMADKGPRLMRVGAAQPQARVIDHRLKPAELLAQVDQNLVQLEALIAKAGQAGCDVLALPEDTLGTLKWEAGNREALRDVLPVAVGRMLDRLGRAAAKHRMYLVCCNDLADAAGAVRNTAFFLGRDGMEVGRYYKVNLPIHEQSRTRGMTHPVFPTPEGKGADDIAIADIDPFGGRDGGDAMNQQRDTRVRLFRERSPAAYGILTDPEPPVLKKVPAALTVEDAVRIAEKVLTVGDARFREADDLRRAGKTDEAIRACEKLRAEFPHSWLDRVARERLATLRPADAGKKPPER